MTDDALFRIRGEYLEVPGLRLTTRQAQRLWHLDRARCEVLLNALVDARFLRRTADSAFVRRDANSPVGNAAGCDGAVVHAGGDRRRINASRALGL